MFGSDYDPTHPLTSDTPMTDRRMPVQINPSAHLADTVMSGKRACPVSQSTNIMDVGQATVVRDTVNTTIKDQKFLMASSSEEMATLTNPLELTLSILV